MIAHPEKEARRVARLGAAIVAAATATACLSGRVLEGYPGYPFLRFDTPLPVDSAFFAVQRAVVGEGFELDFTELASGAVNTRPMERLGRAVFLSIVVGAATDLASETGAPPPSRVWVAGYVQERDGAKRIDPLAEEAWDDLADVAAQLSRKIGGTIPRGPPLPD